MIPVASTGTSTTPKNIVPVTRSAVNVAVKVTMGGFVDPNVGTIVHLIGTEQDTQL